MTRLKLTKGQAQQVMGIVRAELRQRLGFHLDVERAPSHGALRDAVVARLQGAVPWDGCPCGGLLRLDGVCQDCREKRR